jgi:hypothetical protein
MSQHIFDDSVVMMPSPNAMMEMCEMCFVDFVGFACVSVCVWCVGNDVLRSHIDF